MKSNFLIAILLVTVFSGYAFGNIANSTSYKAFFVLDTAGGRMNSTSTNAVIAVDQVFGISSSAQSKACLGYVCVEFGPFGEIIRITFLLQLDIDGTAGDTAVVDTITTPGVYRPNEISKFFGCIEDSSISGSPTFGVAFAGGTLNYIKLDDTEGFSIRMSQDQPDNSFVLPVTTGGCSSVAGKMPLGFPYTPFVPFTELLSAVELIASYPVDLIGNFERTGSFTLTLEKTGNSRIEGGAP